MTAKKIVLALVAVAAMLGALLLLFYAAFPYLYAESGSARYAREHVFETFAALLGAVVLLGVAWYCIRHSLPGRVWLAIAGLVAVAAILQSAARYRRKPDGSRPIGGNWYVTVTHTPNEIDTVYYGLYYKNGAHYQEIHDLVSGYRFVAPDCLVFRGLIVVGHPVYAMCGFRSPAGSHDTTATEEALLARARAQPKYQDGWESIVQQQNF